MLPTIKLDDEMYDLIVDKAKKSIATIDPDWTDYNEHDPGITFIELFAWLKEMQHYHMDQIGIVNELKYLKLLGMKRQCKQQASVYVNLYGIDRTYTLLKGSKAYAGELPFELEKSETVDNVNITEGISITDSTTFTFRCDEDYQDGKMKFPVFGTSPKVGNQFIMYLDAPLEEEVEYTIYFDIYDDYPVKRNPIIDNNFIPLAKIKYDYFDGSYWREAILVEDDSFQLLQTGIVRIVINKSNNGKNKEKCDCKLRLTLVECEYEVGPIIKGISLSVVHLYQMETLIEPIEKKVKVIDRIGQLITDTTLSYENNTLYIEESPKIYREIPILRKEILHNGFTKFLFQSESLESQRMETDSLQVLLVNYSNKKERLIGIGDGFPNQVLDLNDVHFMPDRFQIMIEDEFHKDRFVIWQQVEDFDASNPEDCHYQLDEMNGKIIFGDCINGLAPVGRIYLNSYAVTMASTGNIMAEKIKEFQVIGDQKIPAYNTQKAFGGKDMETIKECFLRFQQEMNLKNCAVTCEDYERIIKGTQGLMIQNVKALPSARLNRINERSDELSITLVVEPFTMNQHKNISKQYYKNIYMALEKARMIGSSFRIVPPVKIGLSIYLEVAIYSHYTDSKEYLRKVVEEYVQSECSEFGKIVVYSNFYGHIDTLASVHTIKSLSIEATGNGIKRTMNGDILTPANGHIYLKELNLEISYEE